MDRHYVILGDAQLVERARMVFDEFSMDCISTVVYIMSHAFHLRQQFHHGDLLGIAKRGSQSNRFGSGRAESEGIL
jgi:hypothetical protein